MSRPAAPHEHDVSRFERQLRVAGYLATRPIALAVYLARSLGRPLLLEGPAGVGKTDLARATAEALGLELIRLQCYEGLDEGRALYEWDYAKQILFTQLLRDAVARQTDGAATLTEAADRIGDDARVFFSERFLTARPVLRALQSERPSLLLIDEVDRADPEFEAFLLEVLSEFQITIPELGTVRARHIPLVMLTTNGTRDMTDALRRRCLHAHLDYPSPARELAIVRARAPDVEASLAAQLVAFVDAVRRLELRKPPSISETIDWARALVALGGHALGPELVRDTLGVLAKFQGDHALVEAKLTELVARAHAAAPGLDSAIEGLDEPDVVG